MKLLFDSSKDVSSWKLADQRIYDGETHDGHATGTVIDFKTKMAQHWVIKVLRIV